MIITQKKFQAVIAFLVFVGAVLFTGCAGAYKTSGQYKRDLLLDRIEKAQLTQQQAKNHFEKILVQYSTIIEAGDEEIRRQYNSLSKECMRAQNVTEQISKRIKDIEEIGKPLFRDWEDELLNYRSEKMRRASEEQLNKTRTNYLKVLHSIKTTQSKIDDVLDSINDQVLFLSHNLNKKALAAFEKETTALQEQVDGLVKQMDVSIQEAQNFINANKTIMLAKLEEEN